MRSLWKSLQPETQRKASVSVSIIPIFNNLSSPIVSGLDMSQRKKGVKEIQGTHRNLKLRGHPVDLKGHISNHSRGR